MKLQERSALIEEYLDEILPNAGCELIYKKDYEFLIAVMLSAQCTDKKVNSVTSILFAKYKNLDDLEKADVLEVEEIIKPLGLYKNKAKNIKLIVHDLIYKYGYKVPSDKKELVTLAGVGNKTASVYRAEILHEHEFPVDTHVERVSKRLFLVKDSDNVLKIESKLKKIFDEEKWVKLHHQFIHFGRYKCKAASPICGDCKLQKICKFFQKPSKT